MLTAVYATYTILLAIALIAAIRLNPQQGRGYYWVLLAVLIGLVYDNLVLTLGRFIGEGELLKTLTSGRYTGHAFGTPLLTIFAFGAARRAGLTWAQSKLAHALICLFTTILIGLGIYTEIIQLDLVLRPLYDVVRYSNTAVKGPPIPAIMTILAMMAMGITVWRRTGWRWMAAGAVFMFIAAAVGTGERIFIANLGEVVLGYSCVVTARKFFT